MIQPYCCWLACREVELVVRCIYYTVVFKLLVRTATHVRMEGEGSRGEEAAMISLQMRLHFLSSAHRKQRVLLRVIYVTRHAPACPTEVAGPVVHVVRGGPGQKEEDACSSTAVMNWGGWLAAPSEPLSRVARASTDKPGQLLLPADRRISRQSIRAWLS
jgi:hypothetical protein